ncbi:Alpha/Beta hydrolase protein [Cristinia sonorae]|uniref:Alpha/Beta hydrolase protein n=1 Tax=Cristinia sonorae TaxID=1940300 RepID=A0A8K0XNP9_9AGAR|nr:Alpha/Beta hydrolase protein [Cristinia sonorae]
MFTGSYPKPDFEWSFSLPHIIRSLEPITPPSHLSETPLPSLPSPPRRSLLHPEWILTTHLVPAASPRTTPLVPVPTIPQFTPGKDKAERKAQIDALSKELSDAKTKQWKGELKGLGKDETKLWCCLNRYVRTKQTGSQGVTLFFAHANGFHKEIWEPTLLALVKTMGERGAAYEVSEIWTWDAVNHGDSALVNAGKLSGIFDWQDNARDIANFLLHYLPGSPRREQLPTHLQPVPVSEALNRQQRGFADRTLVGVGHSFGGASLVWMASHHPYKHLLSSLILVDPIITGVIPFGGFSSFINGKIQGALSRRDHWTSRDEALRLFKAVPFFQRWDPAVLDVYIQCGTYEVPEGGVRLKMQPIHEAITFSEMMSTCEAWFHLPNIDEQTELMFVMPAGYGEPGSPEKIQEKQQLVWRRPVNASNVLNPKAGHLIAQETPKELAEDIHEFLQRKYAVIKNRL